MFKPAIIAGLLAALLGGGYWYRDHVYDSGYEDGVTAQKAIGDKALKKANDDAWARERDLQTAADEANTKRSQDNAKYQTQLEEVRTAARAGAERLSIRTAARACPAPAAAAASPAPGPGPEERADVLPGTADDVFRIAGRSSQDVLDYNALLERYHADCR